MKGWCSVVHDDSSLVYLPHLCAGMGPIYMNEVKCVGHERSIWNCPFKNITEEDCQHTEDASVRCNVPYMGLENSVRAANPKPNVLSKKSIVAYLL